MTSSFWKRKIMEAGSVIFICLVLLWWNPTKILTPVRNFLWVAFEPIVMFSQYSRVVISDVARSLVQISSLKKENARLLSEAVQLRSRVANLEDIQKENDYLRSEIEVALRHPDHIATALVVGYDSRGMGDWVIINKGSRDGIAPEMTVVSGEGVLVGTIEEVLTSTARVRLITHPEKCL